MAERKSIVEKTDTRGLFEMKFPWVGGIVDIKWPATNRSIMVVMVATIMALTIITPTCCYLIFVAGSVENIDSVGSALLLRNKPEKREPQIRPTEDGIEIVTGCPPCECPAVGPPSGKVEPLL